MMRIRRREFLGWLAAAGAAAKSSFSYAQSNPPTRSGGLSILQGMTDEVSAQFSIVLPRAEEFTLEVVGGKTISLLQSYSRTTSEYLVRKFMVSDLEPGVDFTLKIFRANGELADERVFRALDISRSKAKIAFISCAMDHLHKAEVWDQLAGQNPDICFFLGDNVYADRKSLFEKVKDVDPVLLWNRYVETRNKVSFYFQKRLTPTLATWDDHDFGGNNVDKSYPHSAASKEIFETFFAQSSRPALAAGPGIARHFAAFGADFFLLDGRSFRDAPSPGGRIFGEEQEAWLYGRLQPRPGILLSGSLFFGAYAEGLDSFEGEYQQNFAEFRERIRASGAIAAFASGDVHYSEIMNIEPEQLGYPTFELVSSSIHSLTFPGIHDRFTNPRRVHADSTPNFMLLEAEFSHSGIKGEAICWTGFGDQFRAGVEAFRGNRNTNRV